MRAPPVHEQPNCTLYQWIIVEAHGHYFLVGDQSLDLTALRRSTPIVSIDVETLTCRTQSGRHYQLLQPRATGDIATCQLNYFLASVGVVGVDATTALLDNPDLIYTSFHLVNTDTGHAQPALPFLQTMTAQPAVWLGELSEMLASHDVDPHALTVPLRLSPAEWQLWQAGQLTSVSMQTAFRGRILREIIFMKKGLAVATEGKPYVASEYRESLIKLLKLDEMHLLLAEHRNLAPYFNVDIAIRFFESPYLQSQLLAEKSKSV